MGRTVWNVLGIHRVETKKKSYRNFQKNKKKKIDLPDSTEDLLGYSSSLPVRSHFLKKGILKITN